MVATSTPVAAQAGLDVLKKGGNAVDAAVATAAALTVVEPSSNGIGSDNFALIWSEGKLHGLNASGKSPMLLNREEVLRLGHTSMPFYGPVSVTVPGAPGGWNEMVRRFGKLSLRENLAPAIDLAENGFAVGTKNAYLWNEGINFYVADGLVDGPFKHIFETFTRNGKCPEPGDIVRLKDHARTLTEIGQTNAESFYRGNLAQKIDDFMVSIGGYLRAEDLAMFQPEWVEPISVNYKGYDVHEMPPNGHGIVALMALNLLKKMELSERESSDTYHKMIEAIKLAFVDGQKYITDPAKMTVKVEELLSDAYAQERVKQIGSTAILPQAGDPRSGGTVYLCTADGEGNMVSLIQSNYNRFGSGLVVPGTGISLQDRGANFSLDPEHDNCLEPGKRPYHTIIPGFLTKDGRPVGPFGVMGGFMQPQGHVQVVVNTVDYAMNPQDALDAPRFQWVGEKKVQLESSVPDYVAAELAQMGHEIIPMFNQTDFGRGQIIWRSEDGSLVGATEPRTDGTIAVW
ncbi:MAG TPA: gamma-glutamyltransferase [Tissierellia bacterium]|nr:gamma-glutamyltransferase [Tissierellia bacterium]